MTLAFWILDPIYNFFGSILAFFYGLVPNLGISIVMLTLVVMLAMFPLTAKQAKSMLHMQRAQPEIKKLQAKYKHDRAKLNEETMKFYQENKINPLAGCLPLVVQMPIFITLYRLMREPYKHLPTSSDLYHDFCVTAGKVVPKAACGKSPLPHHLSFLGMDLSQHATAVKTGFGDALPYFVLVGLVILTGFLQARQSKRNAPNMNAQMAMVTNILPIMFGLFSLQFPAGLVLYFLVSNSWRLGQQELIMRRITMPGRAALESGGATAVIDVESTEHAIDTPKAPGGLRKLFQLPPSGNGATGESTTGNGGGNGAKQRPAPSGGRPVGRTGSTPGKGSSASGQRRRNNKRKKRR